MEGTVLEVGVRGSTAASASTRWHWDVSVYYANIDDEILSVDDPLAPGTSLSANVDGTIHAGVEALIGASLALDSGAWLEPLVSLTVNDFSFDGDPTYGNNDLPAAPSYAARGEVIYRLRNGFYVGPTFDLIGSRYVDFVNSAKVDSYNLLGLRAGYSTMGWEVFGELRNLTDEDYIATFSVVNRVTGNDEIYLPGAPTTAFVGARWSF
jgi:iron complex outermembrane receptor protein